MTILIKNINNRWVYDNFIRKTDSPISEQKEKMNNYLEHGLIDLISKHVKKEFDIIPKRLAVEFLESENAFKIIRIGVL